MTDLNFDFRAVNPVFEGNAFLPVSPPQGWLVVLTKDEGWQAVNGKPNNFYLKLSGVAQDGPVAGKEFSLRFNLKNDNPKAMAAAAQELAALGYVLGLPGFIGNTAELLNKPFRVVSEQQVDKEGKPTEYTQLATNGIRDANGNKAGQAGAGPQTAQPAPQAPNAPPAGGAPFAPQGQPAGGAPFAQPGTGAPAGGSPFPGGGAPAGGAPFNGQPAGGAPFTGQPAGGSPFGGAPAGANPNPFGAPAGGAPAGGAPAWAAQPGR